MGRIELRLDIYSLLIFFTLTYTICPVYFILGPVSARDLLILLFGFCCLFSFFFENKMRIKVNSASRAIICALFIWSVSLSLIQVIHGEFIYALRTFLLWAVCVPIAAQSINTKNRFIKLIDVITYLYIIVSIFGIVEEFTKVNIFDVLFNTVDTELNYNAARLGIFRIISFTSHAITYSTFCMFGLGIILYRQTIKKSKLNIIAYALVLVSAFFTLARSGLIVILLSQLLLLWFCGYHKFIKRFFQIVIALFVVGLIGYIAFPEVRKALNLAGYVVLALFDDSYVGILRSMGFTDNTSGFGTRLQIYRWVYERLAPNYLFGKGREAEFAVYLSSGGYSTTKTAIEVEWAQTLYRYGFLGLIVEAWYYLTILLRAIGKKAIKATQWESSIGFSKVMGAIIAGYIVESFAVSQNNELQMFSVLMMLYLAYVTNIGFQEVSR